MIGWRQTPRVEPEDEVQKGFDDFELRLGDVMRGERATLGKSLLDVQRELKIRATYISAIEHADPSAFETPGFVAGYVRSYARYLGLDPEWAYQTFCEEGNFEAVHGMDAAASGTLPQNRAAAQKARKAPLDPLSDPNASFVPRSPAVWSRIEPGAIGSVLVLCLLVTGLGFGGWTVLHQIQRVDVTPVDQAPGVVAQVDPLAEAGALVADADTPGGGLTTNEDALSRLYRPQPLDVPVLVARDGPISTLQPGALGALAGASPQPPLQVAQSALPTPPTPDASAIKVVEDAYPAVAVAALRPAWVRITAADGTVLFEKILDAGESYDLQATENPASLRAGNSGAVYFVVNGEAYGPAAPGAAVVKNVSLAAADLKQSYEQVDPAQAEVATMVAELRTRWQDDAEDTQ